MHAGIKTPPADAMTSIVLSATTTSAGLSLDQLQIVNMVTGKLADVSAPTRTLKRGDEEVPTPT